MLASATHCAHQAHSAGGEAAAAAAVLAANSLCSTRHVGGRWGGGKRRKPVYKGATAADSTAVGRRRAGALTGCPFAADPPQKEGSPPSIQHSSEH